MNKLCSKSSRLPLTIARILYGDASLKHEWYEYEVYWNLHATKYKCARCGLEEVD